MAYGLITSVSVLLSDIADALKEYIGKDDTADRLSRHLKRGLPRRHPERSLDTA
jgi:hypothetical protein